MTEKNCHSIQIVVEWTAMFRHSFLLEIHKSSAQGYGKHQYYDYFPSTVSTRCTRRSKTD